MTNFYQKLAVTTAAVALTLAVSAPKAAQAAIITYDFIFKDPQRGDVGSGWLSYDDQSLTGMGKETLDPTTGKLSLSFSTPLGTFDQSDPLLSQPPFVEFQDGTFWGLQYNINIPDLTINITGSTFDFSGFVGVVGQGNVEYTRKSPEPTSTLSLLALGTLGAASTLKRKLKSSKSTEEDATKVG